MTGIIEIKEDVLGSAVALFYAACEQHPEARVEGDIDEKACLATVSIIADQQVISKAVFDPLSPVGLRLAQFFHSTSMIVVEWRGMQSEHEENELASFGFRCRNWAVGRIINTLQDYSGKTAMVLKVGDDPEWRRENPTVIIPVGKEFTGSKRELKELIWMGMFPGGTLLVVIKGKKLDFLGVERLGVQRMVHSYVAREYKDPDDFHQLLKEVDWGRIVRIIEGRKEHKAKCRRWEKDAWAV